MSDIATIIADMVRAGVDPELIGRAAQAFAQPKVDEQAERRRAADRERKRALRLRKSAESAESADMPLPPKESPQTPKEIPLTQKENTPLRGVQKKGTRLPINFEPDVVWAQAQGMSSSQASAEVAKFRDYWNGKAQNATKLDWPATWRNWVRTAVERTPTARGSPAKAAGMASMFGAIEEFYDGRQRDEGKTGGSPQAVVLGISDYRKG